MDLEYAAGGRADGAGIVPQVRPVGRAHLVQCCACRFDQVRQPEAGADLNEFPAAHHHLPAGGERCSGQHQRGSSVVDHQRILCGGTGGEQGSAGTGAPVGAAAGFQIELHVHITAGCDKSFNRTRRKRCATEVGVDDDAGCVEHRAQGCRRARCDGGQKGRFHLAWSELTAPRLLLGLPDEFAQNAPTQALPGCADGGQCQQIIGARDQAARIDLVHSPSSFRGITRRWLAEADGNRTRQAEILGLTGFEDRGAHQDPDATAFNLADCPPGYARRVNEAQTSIPQLSDDVVGAVRLTGYARGGGCACKIPPGELEEAVRGLTGHAGADVLVGLDSGDDAAAVLVRDDLAVLSTADFFTPVVDDAFDWGRIAAANALSDIYAMGGRPIMAINLLGWPRGVLPPELMTEVLRGGLSIASEAAAR